MMEKHSKTGWTALDIPPQHGRVTIITGTGGLGYETALVLARAGGEITLASRNPDKGAAAVNKIRAAVPTANIRFEVLDLADLASIKEFGARRRTEQQSLDLLINNAGVMAPPRRRTTSDGFELQFGTNYLGHFALTALLLPLLRRGEKPRVVNLCSLSDRSGAINFDDLQAERQYKPMPVYGQSKLANLMFSLELQRRSDANGWGLLSIAAHPGVSRTDLLESGPGAKSMMTRMIRLLGPLISQPAAQGALSTLFAATSPDAVGGAYYGPDGLGGLRGRPALARVAVAAKDTKAATRLWEISERLTNISFGD